MIHPHAELRYVSATVGHGLFAKQPIPAGTVVWIRDPLDRAITAAEVAAMPKVYGELLDRYTWRGDDGTHHLAWDFARYANHACDPNCAGTESDFEVAVRDIAAGEQLTNDYGTFNMLPHEVFDCHCGGPACRGKVKGSVAHEVHERLRQAVLASLSRAAQLAQPLLALFDRALWPAEVLRAMGDLPGSRHGDEVDSPSKR